MTNPVDRLAERLEAAAHNERALLGAVLRYPDCLAEAQLRLTPEDFSRHAHQAIFRAMLDLALRGDQPDLIAVTDLLHRRNLIADVRYEYLASLYEHPGTLANLGYYVAAVADAALLRNLALLAHDLLKEAQEPSGPAEEALGAAAARIHGLASRAYRDAAVSLAEALAAAARAFDARCLGEDEGGVLSGFANLDALTGGWRPGDLVILAARPSQGKTALGFALAQRAALEGQVPTLFCSLEQAHRELAERLWAGLSGVGLHHLRRGTQQRSDLDRLAQTHADVVRQAPPLVIDDAPRQSVLRIAAQARRLQARPEGLRLIVVDYLQLVEPASKREPRQEQVAGISRALKALARELKVPVIALAQLNRASENRTDQRPRLADLRESGSLEQDADTVLLLHPQEPGPGLPPGQRPIEVIVAKQRNGPTGEVALVFEAATLRFREHIVNPYEE